MMLFSSLCSLNLDGLIVPRKMIENNKKRQAGSLDDSSSIRPAACIFILCVHALCLNDRSTAFSVRVLFLTGIPFRGVAANK